MKQRIVSALLRLYPAAWRQEYGPEFRHLLEALEPRVRTVADIVWNGLRQRLRATEPWLLLGLPLMLFTMLVATVSIVAPPPYSPAQDPLHEPTAFKLILELAWLSLTAGCGLWTVLRSGGTLPHAGWQTVKMGLLRAVPAFVVAILMATGALGVIVIGPGDTPTTFAQHGFALTVASAEGVAPNPEFLLLTVIGGLIDCWIFGALGGVVGRLIRRKLGPAA